jgi:hypothetical protein
MKNLLETPTSYHEEKAKTFICNRCGVTIIISNISSGSGSSSSSNSGLMKGCLPLPHTYNM